LGLCGTTEAVPFHDCFKLTYCRIPKEFGGGRTPKKGCVMAEAAVVEAGHESRNEAGVAREGLDLAGLTKMYDFTGKSVAITGGAGILGSEIASALAGCGAQVAILDVNPDAGKAAVVGLAKAGGRLGPSKNLLNAPAQPSGDPNTGAQHGGRRRCLCM